MRSFASADLRSSKVRDWNKKRNSTTWESKMFALNPHCRCLILACVLVSACGGGDNPTTRTAQDTSSQGSSCTLTSAPQGIEGTGRLASQKITGRITGLATPGTHTVVTFGSTCSFTADGASVYQGTAPASLSDLRVDQIITAEGNFTDAQNASASSIFILQNGGSGQLPLVQLAENFAPTVRGTWYLFDGPEYSVLPQAQVFVDGNPVSVSGLTIGEGEIVLLAGAESFSDSNNPGGLLASSHVKITHLVDGPVDAIDLVHNQIVVLGVTVEFAPGTFFEMTGGQLTPGAINVGDRVTVNGHPTASGLVFATRFAFSAITGDFLVSGIIQSPNPAQQQFTLNGVTIDYSKAQLIGLPAGGPVDGERALVRATRAANSAILNATSISDESGISEAAIGAVVAMHGIVTSVSSPSLLTVDGYPITVSDAALQTCGSTPPVSSDVTLQGALTANGTVLADTLCLTPDGASATPTAPGLVQGTIQAIDPKYGTISILGFSAQPSALLTRVVDSNGSPLSLGDLKVGDSIAVDGAYGSVPGAIWVDGIVRLSGVTPSLVEANVYQLTFAEPIFYVKGWPIATDSSTSYNTFSRTQFWGDKRQWPGWDKICSPDVSVSVRINPDGSLTALSVTEVPESDGC
jgi:hypothetical protein